MSQVEGGRIRQKQRTRSALLRAARDLLEAGRQPALQEVADHAMISRATAYRYYSNIETLLQEAVLDGIAARISTLQLAREQPGDAPLEQRIETVVVDIIDMVLENEALFRTYLRGVVAGENRETRGGRRLVWLREALGPDASRLSRTLLDRVVYALALLTGIETVVVARDVCGLDDKAIRTLCRWTARAILSAALAEAGGAR